MDYTRLQPVEPQSLVGEWTGNWLARDDIRTNTFTLVITRVDGNRVFATLDVWGGVGHGRFHHERNVQGTLQGNDLMIGPYYTFRVDGWRMNGVGRRGAELKDIELVKRSADVRQQVSGIPVRPGAAGRIDGVYAGPVCYDPGPSDPARCYHAEAAVRDGTIVGEWRGRDGVTVKLAGEVSTIGEVKVEMHAERSDGTQFAQANLSGTIENGRLDAHGAFLNGRALSFRWELTAPGGGHPQKRDRRR